ncbi:hypothetical protein CBR_g49363 [Chara braunii]|uniref:[RNA-polymerase]-subunit kinase n=1 Tax=Chara braunii TaxID=69332 RepID=A0A388M4R3_CHABU|nr:hypothetical protein CBR_g49363 [Chara braunii]|eukprot:GBG89574.1 hypothetical protein CBR_g49363 [Chara braunii]
MAAAPPFDLNLVETPSWGARSVECFEKLDQIGEGTYGQVYMAREKVTGEIVALKKVRMDNEKEGFPITAIREIKILKKLNHENVIKLKEIVTSKATDSNKYKGHIYMVFEYMDHDLTGLADRPGMRFTIPQIKCYMQQLLKGLHYCHLNQVLHRDIKGSNLLIDNNGVLKLADFGLARSFSSENNCPLTNRVITLWYRPPELLLGATKYGPAVDMWSVGCIFAELLSGRPILPGKNELEQLQLIFQLCGTPDESNWEDVTKLPLYSLIKNEKPHPRQLHINFKNFHPSALKLVEKLLTLDPKKRLSAKDALDSDYFWTDPMPCDPGRSSSSWNVVVTRAHRPGRQRIVVRVPCKTPTIEKKVVPPFEEGEEKRWTEGKEEGQEEEDEWEEEETWMTRKGRTRGRGGHEEGEDTRKGRRRGGMEDEEVRGGGGDKEDEEGQKEEDEQEEDESKEMKRRREAETWRMRKGRSKFLLPFKQFAASPVDLNLRLPEG